MGKTWKKKIKESGTSNFIVSGTSSKGLGETYTTN